VETFAHTGGRTPTLLEMAVEETDDLGISPEKRRCIEATSDCYIACTETLNYSLDGGDLRDPKHLRLLVDCGEILQTTQNALLRGSELWRMLATVCAEACEKVAENCRQLDGSDEQLVRCAEACDETAESCRQLSLV
jgi:hypothetical protein